MRKGILTLPPQIIRKPLEMNATSVTGYFGRGNTYFAKKSWDSAVVDMTKVIELSPKNAAAFAKRGEAFEKKGNLDLAEADYNKAFELDASNESAKASAERLKTEREKAGACKG